VYTGLRALVAANEQGVATGPHRFDGGFFDGPLGGDRLHLEIVGEEDPVEAELGAEQAGANGSRQRGGNTGIDLVVDHVRRHERGDASADGGAKGGELYLIEAIASVAHDRQREVAVHLGVAMSGKVLSARENVRSLQTADERDTGSHHGSCIGAECAIADDRVFGLRVDVENRSEVQVEPDGAELGPHRGGRRHHQIEIAERRELAHRRKSERGRRKANHTATFLIDSDERRQIARGGLEQGRAEICRPGHALQVALEENRPPAPLLGELASEARRQGGPRETPYDHLANERRYGKLQLHAERELSRTGPFVRITILALGCVLLAGCVPRESAAPTTEPGKGSAPTKDAKKYPQRIHAKHKPDAIARPGGTMSLGEARRYLLRLINRDREAEGLEPVTGDGPAEKAGQEHAVDMATHGYTAHWGTDGSVPEVRYTMAGGMGMVQENAACVADGKDRKLDASGPFNADELERVEAAFMGEKPPSDGHRRNILTAWHNRVGIGIAKPAGVPLLCVAQEFVDHYGDYGSLASSASVGKSIRVSGDVMPPAVFGGVGLARIDPPPARSAAELNQTHGYPVPTPYVTYFPKGFVTPIPVKVDGKTFAIDVPLDDEKRPGIYEVSVWASVPETKDLIMVSLRTIAVK